ncbi:hypothetical protein [Niabella beijingensis]|uniref:hypothetical protein n=1 Tax=Niabella beijingensis TaxID=2872700 RepID=UPI001CBE7252|nr:hypothetical protein [Niabella beijingensis]MBZ4189393.1 hypothetical protein [Niabella beijingensis]
MFTKLFSLQAVALILFAGILFTGCKKDRHFSAKDADGYYLMTEIEYQGKIYTRADGVDGDITIEDNGTYMEMYVTMDDEEVADDYFTIVVKASGDKLNIYEADGVTQVGDIQDNVLELRAGSSRFRATKR